MHALPCVALVNSEAHLDRQLCFCIHQVSCSLLDVLSLKRLSGFETLIFSDNGDIHAQFMGNDISYNYK